MALSHKKPIVFLDCETTGVDVENDRVVELAVIRVEPDGTRTDWQSRINPGMPIPAEATAVNHISTEDVEHCPRFEDVAHQVAEMCSGAIPCGYKVRTFDLPMLAYEFQRAGVPSPFEGTTVLDLMEIFAHLIPRTLSGAVALFCGMPHLAAHEAHGDAAVCIKLLASQLEYAKDSLPHDAEDLAKTCAPEGVDRWLDPLGKLVRGDDGGAVINFGQYQGKRVADMDDGWVSWFLKPKKDDFSQTAKAIVAAEMVRRISRPSSAGHTH